MTIAAVQNTTTSTSSTASSGLGATSAADLSNQFMTLLVTQLRNQDPMNPMDNAQVTSQLAQLSTVDGINKMNDSLTALAAQFQASQALQGASLIGHQVLAQGSVLNLGSSGAAGGGASSTASGTPSCSESAASMSRRSSRFPSQKGDAEMLSTKLPPARTSSSTGSTR